MENKIKNLLIDFGGVLIDLDRERCIRSFKQLGLDNIEELVNPYYQQGFFMQLEKGEISAEQFRNEIRRLSGRELTDFQIDTAWNSFLINIPVAKINLLLNLRRYYKVYLLSNTNEIHWQWACENCFKYKEYNVEDYFEDIFLSYKLHQVKPHENIFRSVMEKANISPEETFFIDDAEANCRTAVALGIKSYMPVAGEDWSHLFDGLFK